MNKFTYLKNEVVLNFIIYNYFNDEYCGLYSLNSQTSDSLQTAP